MKAVLYRSYGEPGILEYSDVPDPVAGADEVVVRLQAASVAPFDCKLRAGLLQQHFQVAFPAIPGRDGAGTVEAVGAGVTDLTPGDRVCVVAGYGQQGTCAEKIAVPRRNIVLCPTALTPVQAVAGLNAGVNAHTCFTMADIQPGQRVLIHGGAGAVGGILVQLCHKRGAHVTATCRASNRDYVIALGADRVIAYDAEDFGTLSDIDIVFDLIGGEVHDRSYPVLRRGGRLVYLNALPIIDRGLEYGVTVMIGSTGGDASPETIGKVLELAATGAFLPQVASTLPLPDAADAHRRMEAGLVTRGRLVLTI